MRQLLSIITMSLIIQSSGNALNHDLATSTSYGMITSVSVGHSLLEGLSLVFVSAHMACVADRAPEMLKCVFKTTLEMTDDLTEFTSRPSGAGGKKAALIEDAQQDLLDVVAGNNSQYQIIQELIELQQKQMIEIGDTDATKQNAAIVLYNTLETLKQ